MSEEAFAKPEFSLAALVEQHCRTDLRPIVKHAYCLNRPLVDQLVAVEAEQETLEQEQSKLLGEQEENRQKSRYGVPSRLQEIADELAAVSAQVDAAREAVSAASVMIVCRSFTSDAWGGLLKEFGEQPMYVMDQEIICRSFSHFERDDRRLPEGVDTLKQMVSNMSYGDTRMLAEKVKAASAEGVDIPFFARRSQTPPN